MVLRWPGSEGAKGEARQSAPAQESGRKTGPPDVPVLEVAACVPRDLLVVAERDDDEIGLEGETSGDEVPPALERRVGGNTGVDALDGPTGETRAQDASTRATRLSSSRTPQPKVQESPRKSARDLAGGLFDGDRPWFRAVPGGSPRVPASTNSGAVSCRGRAARRDQGRESSPRSRSPVLRSPRPSALRILRSAGAIAPPR